MINNEIAQKIVDAVGPLIHSNVNIMDKKGMIIASSDNTRVGTIHPIALKIISNDNNDKEYGIINETMEIDGWTVKPGVNLPINYKNKIIGVVGVTGDPLKIIEHAKLIQYTVELLVWREYSTNKIIFKQMMISDFIAAVLDGKEINPGLIQELDDANININSFKYCTLVKANGEALDKLRILDDLRRLFPTSIAANVDDNVVIFSSEPLEFENYFSKKDGYQFFIGCKVSKWKDLDKSFKVAQALSLYTHTDLICRYKENKLTISIILNYLGNPYIYIEDLKKYAKLVNKPSLYQTYEAYIKYNGSIKDICDNLYIHRNTIIYRIQKIEELTKCNLHSFVDSFRLYSLHTIYQILSKAEKEELLKNTD